MISKNLDKIAEHMLDEGAADVDVFEWLWLNTDSMRPDTIAELAGLSPDEGQRQLDRIHVEFCRTHGAEWAAASMFAAKAEAVFMVHGEWPTWATDSSLGFTCRKNTPEETKFVRKHINAFAKDRKRRRVH